MTKNYLSLFSLLTLCSLHAQRSTIVLQEGFEYIAIAEAHIDFYLVAHDNYTIVTDGIPLNGISFEIHSGVLDLRLHKEAYDGQESLVILFPEDAPVPKMLCMPFAEVGFEDLEPLLPVTGRL
ncbi:MAG: hypothetical protein AAGF77_03410 [Bacteroidota bacterium]